MEFYIAQGISILTALTAIIGMQMKDMKAILLSQILSNVFTASTYLLLGGFSGAGICIVAIVQAIVMFSLNRKEKSLPTSLIALFIILYIGCSVVYYKHFIDVFSALAAVCYAMSITQKNPKASRLWYVLNPLFWMIYDLYTRAYGNLIMHASIFVSTTIALIRVDGIFKRRSEKFKQLFHYFTSFEWCLWIGSSIAVILSFLCGGEFYFLTLIASLIGVTSLIFIAKGNVIGQFLIIIFSVLYGIVSIRFHYWGEMLTYLGMSLPAAIFAAVSWLKNPSKESKNEVLVATMTKKKCILSILFSLGVTVIFYFLLDYLNTANLYLSVLSVATSFLAASFLFLRSRYYAIAYAANDVVLIGLWTLASIQSLSYLPMVICFVAFLCNDLYGFINWKRMQDRQNSL